MTAEVKKDIVSRKKTPFSVRFAIFWVLVAMVIFLPTTVLFCGALLPTLVAVLVDDRPQKTAWVTVGAMNFAGILPVWFQLWSMGHTLENAFMLLMRADTLAVAYGAAAVGWIIQHQIPALVAGIMARRGERRLQDIDKRQKDILRKWGKDVVS